MSVRHVSHRANAPNLSHCACSSENVVHRLLILHCSSGFSCPYNHNILFSVLFRFYVTFKFAFIIEFLSRCPDVCRLPTKLIYFKSCQAHSSFDCIRTLKLRTAQGVFPALVSVSMHRKTHPVLVAMQ